MGSRGRKSSAELSVVHGVGESHIFPPEHLTGRAREVFIEIVNSTDPKHFAQSDIPILTAFVEAVVLKEQAQKAIDEEGAVVDGKKNPWYDILNKQSGYISKTAPRLRLTPHSRYDARAAGRNTKERSGPKPWE